MEMILKQLVVLNMMALLSKGVLPSKNMIIFHFTGNGWNSFYS